MATDHKFKKLPPPPAHLPPSPRPPATNIHSPRSRLAHCYGGSHQDSHANGVDALRLENRDLLRKNAQLDRTVQQLQQDIEGLEKELQKKEQQTRHAEQDLLVTKTAMKNIVSFTQLTAAECRKHRQEGRESRASDHEMDRKMDSQINADSTACNSQEGEICVGYREVVEENYATFF
ncbi:hypothetical protein S40288_11496 [Stachybotrys chartarum IBT 40288]|nr:hypothetical protein S40288_11496 [Stachybotrys chartarum IBT 40288]